MKLRILLAGSLIACGPASREEPTLAAPPAPAPPAAAVEIPASSTDPDALRTAALRLAGLAPGGEEADPEWTRHGSLMDATWEALEKRHLGAMRSWAEAELGLAEPAAPLFYPFSGPDLPSALQFFPEAASYVLVGLEPSGSIPELDAVAGDAFAVELERLHGGLENLVEAGYFVTKKMERDFSAPRLEGVLPMLYIFLARAGMTPQAVHFIRLDAEGRAEPLATATDRTATAVRIDLGEARELYYFSQDLSNQGLAAAPAFAAFLRRLGTFNVYMKSASYLLHMDDFTAIEELLLSHAGTVLQDDSGIPLRDLSPEVWERRLFGTYTQTLPTYREWFQDDLREAYEHADASPLPFAVGYNSRIGGSCLIRAERRGEG